MDLKEDQTMVVVMPDGVRNYMSKFLSDEWMISHNLMEEAEIDDSVAKSSWGQKQVRFLDISPPCTVLPGLFLFFLSFSFCLFLSF